MAITHAERFAAQPFGATLTELDKTNASPPTACRLKLCRSVARRCTPMTHVACATKTQTAASTVHVVLCEDCATTMKRLAGIAAVSADAMAPFFCSTLVLFLTVSCSEMVCIERRGRSAPQDGSGMCCAKSTPSSAATVLPTVSAAKWRDNSLRSAVCISGSVGQHVSSTGINRKQLRKIGRGLAARSSKMRSVMRETRGFNTIVCGGNASASVVDDAALTTPGTEFAPSTSVAKPEAAWHVGQVTVTFTVGTLRKRYPLQPVSSGANHSLRRCGVSRRLPGSSAVLSSAGESSSASSSSARGRFAVLNLFPLLLRVLQAASSSARRLDSEADDWGAVEPTWSLLLQPGTSPALPEVMWPLLTNASCAASRSEVSVER
ncbi:hypothetical protein, conserved [Leishmania tarentolae]|uniref:Uncharacterized protein n=1 Tax=Leishmania tarentolae TaxID=5689 RepID=A0A640KTZ3_LEITA|nr:hypothetical protein, conserved [Leishmania tarentolae]